VRRLLPLILLAGLLACGDTRPPPLSRGALVGDEVCLQCHTEMAEFSTTAHSLSSAVATRAAIHGSFAEGENLLETPNPALHYRMDASEEGFRQLALRPTEEDTTILRVASIDVVIGSGRKGQTYLYWEGDRLFQLPISYWTGVGWANSPGYPSGTAIFNRPADPRCLECHATYARALPDLSAANRYDPESLVLGIGCESCHGPGATHVEVARRGRIGGWIEHTGIVNPADFPRARQVDGCALCHGGIGESLQPPVTYRLGEPLSEYLHQPEAGPDEPVDVHGNQVALLARSACFLESRMTCATCHDLHRPQRDLAEFSATCVSCHAPGAELPVDHGSASPGNCIDCHMPNLETNVIVADGLGGTLRPRVRSHWIRVVTGR